MLKSYALCTSEADVPQIAVQEILAQLSEISLLENSVGVVSCHYDFINNGILSALTDVLPFRLIGITTFYQTTQRTSGLFELSITVLTGDDVSFALGYCGDEKSGEPAERVRAAYAAARGTGAENPALIFSYLSLNRNGTGDGYLRALDAVSGGTPCFGAVTTGDDESLQNLYVVCGGEVLSEGFAMLLITGNVEAEFAVGHFADEKLLEMAYTVTESDADVVRRLNDQVAIDYLKRNGIEFDYSDMDAVSTVPYLIRRPGEDVYIARALRKYAKSGEMEFMGEVPQGSILRAGTVTTEDILLVSRDTAESVTARCGDAAALFMYSCVGRFIALGLDTTAELDHVSAAMPEGVNYSACYAAGEICPIRKDGRLVNTYHNSSFVVCAIRYRHVRTDNR